MLTVLLPFKNYSMPNLKTPRVNVSRRDDVSVHPSGIEVIHLRTRRPGGLARDLEQRSRMDSAGNAHDTDSAETRWSPS